MQKEASQKLVRRNGHQLLLAAVSIILPAESNLAIGKGNDPMVGDGHAMCIASQVMKYVLRTAEGRFGVYDPVLAEQRTKKRTEGLCLRQRCENAGER